jgi:hypothetical protein
MTETPQNPEQAPEPDTGEAANPEVEKWKSLARKHEDRAKEDAKEKAAALRELDKLRTAHLSDTERAIAEAKAAGRAEVLTETGRRLAAAEFRAAAASAGLDVAQVLDLVNVDRFLGEDGTPDEKAITEAVTRFVGLRGEAPAKPSPGLDLGPRSGPGTMPLNGDPILASLKSKLNIP